MRFLSNIYDPKQKDARKYVARSSDETEDEAWHNHLRWLDGKIIGEPQVADVPNAMPLERLKAQHMVGVYAPD